MQLRMLMYESSSARCVQNLPDCHNCDILSSFFFQQAYDVLLASAAVCGNCSGSCQARWTMAAQSPKTADCWAHWEPGPKSSRTWRGSRWLEPKASCGERLFYSFCLTRGKTRGVSTRCLSPPAARRARDEDRHGFDRPSIRSTIN